jgi:predicted kinase
VILDGTYNDPHERGLARDLARHLGARFVLIQTTCPDDVVRSRLAARASDPTAVSDADWEIYTRARSTFNPPEEIPPGERIVDESGGAGADPVIRLLLANPGGVRPA